MAATIPAYERGRGRLQVRLGFTGLALNAVDAKGRVSLPAGLRLTVERRIQRVAAADGMALPQAIMIGPHERHPSLQAFDVAHLDTLHDRLEQRAAAKADGDLLAAFDDEQMRAFSVLEEVAFDGNGRMVLPAGLRRRAGLSDLAFFVGAGETFQIWAPERFLEQDAGPARDMLTDLLAERAAKGKGQAQ